MRLNCHLFTCGFTVQRRRGVGKLASWLCSGDEDESRDFPQVVLRGARVRMRGLPFFQSWHFQKVSKKLASFFFEKWKFEGCATSVVQVDLAPASLMGFEYKYYCVRRDGRGEWEPRGNRSFIKPESGNVVKDGAFGDPDPGSSKVRQTVPRVQITSFKSVSTTESTSPSFEL